jgi:hypothetical protein
MRAGVRILTAVLTLSFMGSPVRDGLCQPVSSSCAETRPLAMSCCQTAPCCCDLSRPSQPTSSPLPERAVSAGGHEMAKIALLLLSVTFLVTNAQFHLLLATDAPRARSTAGALYTLTHAFLI